MNLRKKKQIKEQMKTMLQSSFSIQKNSLKDQVKSLSESRLQENNENFTQSLQSSHHQKQTDKQIENVSSKNAHQLTNSTKVLGKSINSSTREVEGNSINDRIRLNKKSNGWKNKCMKSLSRFFQRKKKHQKQNCKLVKSMTQLKEIQEAKNQRIQYLWHKVRTTVRSQMFLQRLQKSQNITLVQDQQGVMKKKELEKFQLYIKYQKLNEENKVQCLVKRKSLFEQCWTMLCGVVYVITIFFLLYSLSTNQFMLFQDRAHNIFLVIRYFNIFDIVFNLVCEHYQDLEVEKYLKDSIKIYIKTTFFADFLNLVGLFLIEWEFRRLDELYQSNDNQKIQLDKCTCFRSEIMIFGHILCFPNALRFYKIVILNDVMDDWLHSGFSTDKLRNFFKNVFLICYFLIVQLLTIVFFSFLYIFFSSQIQQELCIINEQHFDHLYYKKTAGAANIVHEQRVNHDVSVATQTHQSSQDQRFTLLYRQFFLLLTTLTSVGYGSDMPSYTENPNDTLLLSLIILFGVLTFSKYISELQLKFKQHFAKKSIYSHLVENDQNIEAYFISHNHLWNVRQLTSADLQKYKYRIRLGFNFNFQNIHQDELFNELPPQIKNKLEKVLIRAQKHAFYHFFNDKAKGHKVNPRLVRIILSKLNCQVFTTNQTILTPRDNVSNIYFLSKGFISIYDRYYNFLTQYGHGSFFGEYQVLFNLLSGLTYKTDDSPKLQSGKKACDGSFNLGTSPVMFNKNEILIFTIEKDIFLEVISSQQSNCFDFYNDLAILRFKYMNMLKQKALKTLLKSSNKSIVASMAQLRESSKVSLYTILEIQSQLLGVNDTCAAVYENIRRKRRERFEKLCVLGLDDCINKEVEQPGSTFRDNNQQSQPVRQIVNQSLSNQMNPLTQNNIHHFSQVKRNTSLVQKRTLMNRKETIKKVIQMGRNKTVELESCQGQPASQYSRTRTIRKRKQELKTIQTQKIIKNDFEGGEVGGTSTDNMKFDQIPMTPTIQSLSHFSASDSCHGDSSSHGSNLQTSTFVEIPIHSEQLPKSNFDKALQPLETSKKEEVQNNKCSEIKRQILQQNFNQDQSDNQEEESEDENHQGENQDLNETEESQDASEDDEQAQTEDKYESTSQMCSSSHSHDEEYCQKLEINSDDQVDTEEIVDYERFKEYIHNIELVTHLECQMQKLQVHFSLCTNQYQSTIGKFKEFIQEQTDQVVNKFNQQYHQRKRDRTKRKRMSPFQNIISNVN